MSPALSATAAALLLALAWPVSARAEECQAPGCSAVAPAAPAPLGDGASGGYAEKILASQPCELKVIFDLDAPDKPVLVMDGGHCAYVADLALATALADLLKRTTVVPK